MLVEPVAHERADDPLVPPAACARISLDPGLRRVPVVVDVVVVEDHRARDGGEQPADRRARPTSPSRGCVYSSKSATCSPGGSSGVAARADELARPGRDLVGVDLVAEQQQRVRPLARVAARRIRMRERAQRVDLAARAGRSSLRSEYGGSCGAAHAAGAEHDPHRVVRRACVRMTLGGNGSSGAARRARRRARPRTGVIVPGLEPGRRARARSGGRRRRTSARSQPSTSTSHGASVSTQIIASCLPRVAQQRARGPAPSRSGRAARSARRMS